MRFFTVLTSALYASVASATITWTLEKASNPTEDQLDAYEKIEASMTKAVERYNRLAPNANKKIVARYVPGVTTADANYNGAIRFGTNRSFMNERTCMHEISHTLGIGTTSAFNTKCANNDWPQATALLISMRGAGEKINCGGGHIWPLGLNYDNEWSSTNAEQHPQLINAMLADGM